MDHWQFYHRQKKGQYEDEYITFLLHSRKENKEFFQRQAGSGRIGTDCSLR